MRMETARLILRPWEEADAQALYRYAKDESVGPAAGWTPHTSVEYSREIIRTVLSRPETYAVVLKSAGEPVGSVGIMFPPGGSAPMEEGEAEIGYWLGVPHWGQGLIPEAVFRLQKRCFMELGCKAVWAMYFAGNERSRRVMEKCGFRYQHAGLGVDLLGELRTEHYTRLTREEYLQNSERARRELEALLRAFAVSGWDWLAAPARDWLHGGGDLARLQHAIARARHGGGEKAPYSRALELLRAGAGER